MFSLELKDRMRKITNTVLFFLILLHVSAVLTVLCEVPVDVLKHLQIQQATNSLLLIAKTISLPRPELQLSTGTSVLSAKGEIAVWKIHIPELVETLTTAELLQHQRAWEEKTTGAVTQLPRFTFQTFLPCCKPGSSDQPARVWITDLFAPSIVKPSPSHWG